MRCVRSLPNPLSSFLLNHLHLAPKRGCLIFASAACRRPRRNVKSGSRLRTWRLFAHLCFGPRLDLKYFNDLNTSSFNSPG